MNTSKNNHLAGVEEKRLKAPHLPVYLVSNDVLEAELTLCDVDMTRLQPAQEDYKEKMSELLQRKQMVQIQMDILVTHVQSGKLSLAMYLDRLRGAIKVESKVCILLKQRGDRQAALRVMKRVQLMKQELRGAEENSDQLQ